MTASRRVVVATVAVVCVVGLAFGTSIATDAIGDEAVQRSPSTASTAFDELHRAGVTGEGVTVGIVDPTGFDVNRPTLASHAAAVRSFDAEGDIENGGYNAHGTAMATVVREIAPDAELVLANFDTPAGYRRAVDWQVNRDVDVVFAPLSFYGKPDDGSSLVSQKPTEAAARDVVMVASAGNMADRHWEGTYRPDGRLRFAGGSTRNHLRARGGGTAVLWLSWDATATNGTDPFDVVLYRERPGARPQQVATSQPYRGDAAPNERLVATLEPGQYFVEVYGPTDGAPVEVELESPTHELAHSDPAGSLTAPATARDVIAVGAYDSRRQGVDAFSARGPTADGRRGIDLIAAQRLRGDGGRLTGSSMSSAYVAGTAALVLDVSPASGPVDVERLLEASAVDVGAPGPDLATGHGRVDPSAAVDLARDRRANRTATETPSGTQNGTRRGTSSDDG